MKDPNEARKTGFFKSMRFRAVLLVLLAGCLSAALGFLAGSIYVREKSIKLMNASVKNEVTRLSEKISRNVYTSAPSQSPDITRELDFTASYYDGRVAVTDSNLIVIYDSYSLEYDKYIISTEAILALRGVTSLTRDSAKKMYEMVFPVVETAASSGTDEVKNQPQQVLGIIIINYSVSDCYELAKGYVTLSVLLGVIGLILLIILGNFGAERLVRPLNQVSRALDNVSQGILEEKVEIGGYSEIARISDSINDMLGRIAELENSRQEFVSNVSHELKTPVTSIKILSDSLLAQPDAPVELYREFMQDINSEIDRESTIINDLLAMSRLDRKNGDMHIALVNINEMIEMLLKRLSPLAAAANVELIFESYREVEAEVDEVKLNLSLSNIIENAVKYNKEKGSVKVFLNSDHNSFIVRVTDTGIGIPQSELDNVFDRFYRVDKMRSRETGGTGLGLAISKSIILMHHGTVRVESVEGEGSSFTVKIPLNYIPENA